jgi:hypothetical protein
MTAGVYDLFEGEEGVDRRLKGVIIGPFSERPDIQREYNEKDQCWYLSGKIDCGGEMSNVYEHLSSLPVKNLRILMEGNTDKKEFGESGEGIEYFVWCGC